MDLSALTDFLLVAQHGGFSSAAREGLRSKATLSRQVARLEEELGVRLLERGPNHLRLTDKGLALQLRGQALLSQLEDFEDGIRRSADHPEGVLRLSVPQLFANRFLGDLATAFRAKFPDVVIDAHIGDDFLDLVGERMDLVIRVNPRSVHGLVGRCFFRDRRVVVGTPALHARYMDKPDDRLPSVLLSAFREQDSWLVQAGKDQRWINTRPVMYLPTFPVVRAAALAGAGIAAVPRSAVEYELTHQQLSLLGEVVGEETQIWILHTARRLPPARVSAFVEFVCSYFDGHSAAKTAARSA
ncbi:LysR family transcriptional regulator [Qipengyuania flava]|uniref:LysR family transcriptional regulator n=1 Tax=Qipengyuania flava TaxID=192812 RepID=UPI001CD1EA31|nr:LysR family transcriptional regulator [Qipengyuania flava]MCA0891247.1 LysR family transcriptional regulator [Qipengyuania flava]